MSSENFLNITGQSDRAQRKMVKHTEFATRKMQDNDDWPKVSLVIFQKPFDRVKFCALWKWEWRDEILSGQKHHDFDGQNFREVNCVKIECPHWPQQTSKYFKEGSCRPHSAILRTTYRAVLHTESIAGPGRVKRKEKKLLKMQSLPKVLLAQAIRATT